MAAGRGCRPAPSSAEDRASPPPMLRGTWVRVSVASRRGDPAAAAPSAQSLGSRGPPTFHPENCPCRFCPWPRCRSHLSEGEEGTRGEAGDVFYRHRWRRVAPTGPCCECLVPSEARLHAAASAAGGCQGTPVSLPTSAG